METLTKNENYRIEVVKKTPHLSAETEEALSAVRELPLPVQIALRALQHFADKANDGADVYITYDSSAYFKVMTRRSVFVFEQLSENTYVLYFERQKRSTELIKKVFISCSEETAKRIAGALYSVFSDAVENSNVDIRPIIELFYNNHNLNDN